MATETSTPTVTVHIPTPLQSMTEEQDTVDVTGGTVGDAIETLTQQYPDLRQHLYKEDGALRSFVNIYLEDEDIRYLDNEDTPLEDGQTVSIVPSIAGGC